MSLLSFQMKFKDENTCRDWLAEKRWGGHDKAVCPHCNHNVCYIHTGIDRYTCQSCAKQFSVRANTIFEGSRLPLVKWYISIYLFTSMKKGISSIQLAKYIEVTQKTAWFMLHRIREVMKGGNSPFDGITEVDEAYFGGKEGNKHTINKFKSEKTAVIGLVNRDTKQVRAVAIPNADKENLLPKIGMNIKSNSTIVTDTYHSYKNLKNNYKHHTIKHSAKEYVRLDSRVAFKIHTNTIEGFWSQVKRGIYGVYHWASAKHINRYLNEYAFRYNGKENTDFCNFDNWFGSCEGKKVVYANLIK